MLAWRSINRLLGLISTLILVRILAPEDFGIVSMAFAFSTALEAMSTIGTETQLVRSPRIDRAMYDTAFSMNLCRALLLLALIMLGAEPAAAWFGDARLADVLRAIALLSGLAGLNNIRLVDFQRELDFRGEFIALGVPRLLQAACTVAAALLMRSYWALIVGLFAGRLGGIAFGYLMKPYLPRLTFSAWRLLVAASLWTSGISIALMVRDRVDMFVIGRSFGPAAAGLWAITVEIASLPLSELVGPIARAAMPGFAATMRSADAAEVRETLVRVLALVWLLAIPVGTGISLVSGPLVAIALGPNWDAASPLIAVVAILLSPFALGLICTAFLVAHGRFRRIFFISAASAAFRLVAVLAVGRHWGILGVAASVGVSIWAEQLLLAMACLGSTAVAPGAILRQIWRPPVAAALMATALIVTRLGWIAPPDQAQALVLLLAGCALGMATFTSALLALWFLSGRPSGAETDLMDLAWRFLHPALRTVRRRLSTRGS
jgi:O-antigen/teichoic acid export membrane protein